MKGSSLVLLALAASMAPQDPPQTESGIRFESWDVFLDTGAEALGAYQFEWKVLSGTVRIVGVEGGEHAAFTAAPYYDEAALQRNRIVVGAFSTAPELPRGRTRVARVHLQISGGTEPVFDVQLEVCATADGSEIDARVTNQRTEGK